MTSSRSTLAPVKPEECILGYCSIFKMIVTLW